MKRTLTVIVILMLIAITSTETLAQMGDFLNETGFHGIPSEMTFDEYRDANRRLLPAILMSSAVPIPGMMHFQANEKKTGYKILGAGIIGGITIIAGFASFEEGDKYKDSDYTTIDIGKKRYEKIPILIYDEDGTPNTAYQLKELKKEQDAGAGGALIALGAGILLADYIYDWWHGIHVIQLKRDKVRYKYGQQIKLGMVPTYDPHNGAAGIKLGFNF
jgi:hypothetical protein